MLVTQVSATTAGSHSTFALVAAIVPVADLADACGDDPGLICEWVFDATDSARAAEVVDWAIDRPLRIVLILVVAWVINRIARRLISRFVDRLVERTHERSPAEGAVDGDVEGDVEGAQALTAGGLLLSRIQEQNERARQRTVTLGAVLRSVATGVIYLLAALLVLGELDINLGPLLAGAGIAGIAFGFGAQSLVRDFLAGIFIVIEDQYGVGDVVDVGEATGTVEEVSLRTTRLRDVHGTLWVVPNGEIRRVANMSQLWARVVLDIEVAYDTDLDLASEVIKRVADEVWREGSDDATIIEEPEVWGIESFGPSAVAIRLAGKTEPAEQVRTARVIRRRLKQAFDEAGIEIPFPQQTVWFGEAPAASTE